MSDKPLKLQIMRMPGRERHVFPNIPPTTSINQLMHLISEKTGLPVKSQSLFNGFPPKPIDVSSPDRTLAEAGIKNGDTVEVRPNDDTSSTQTIKQGKGWEYAPSIEVQRGSMVRRDQPRDNSCLFHSIAHVFRNQLPTPSSSQSSNQPATRAAHIREIVANLVASDPQTYSTTFLGSPNALYQQHILNPDTWGGAIELAILSAHFQTEIITFDYHYLREDQFGSDQGFKNRVFLLYHGDHYDSIVWQPQSGSEQVMFSTRDDNAWIASRNYVQALHTETAKRGECTLQKEWRTNEGLKRKDDRSAEKERIKQANDLASKRERDQTANAHVADHMVDDDVHIDDRKSSNQTVDDTEWTCRECTLKNSRSSMMCGACGAPSPFYEADYFPAPPAVPARPSNNSANKPSSTSSSRPSAPSSTSSTFVCNMCTFENSSSAARCEICMEPNPHPPANAVDTMADIDEDGVRAPIPQQEDQLIGGYDSYPAISAPLRRSPVPPINEEILGVEWVCPTCTQFNQPYTTSCISCQEVHPLLFTETAASSSSSSSRPQAPPSGGWKKFLGSQPRWVCETCGVDNVPNLIRCKSCKAPNINALRKAQEQGGNCSIM